MSRTTEEKVRGVIDLEPEIDLALFITNAGVITDRVQRASDETEAIDFRGSATEEELELLETYVAAHLCALKYPREVMEKTSRSSVKYQKKVGKGFEATEWGQMALTLDPTGTLALLNTAADSSSGSNSYSYTRVVGGTWLGS